MLEPILISLTDLERMLDSSLSASDMVHFDHKEYKGEVFLWRHAHWRYWPLDFEILYRVEKGQAVISKFFFRNLKINIRGASVKDAIADTKQNRISDTSTYREILARADIIRRNVP